MIQRSNQQKLFKVEKRIKRARWSLKRLVKPIFLLLLEEPSSISSWPIFLVSIRCINTLSLIISVSMPVPLKPVKR